MCHPTIHPRVTRMYLTISTLKADLLQWFNRYGLMASWCMASGALWAESDSGLEQWESERASFRLVHTYKDLFFIFLATEIAGSNPTLGFLSFTWETNHTPLPLIGLQGELFMFRMFMLRIGPHLYGGGVRAYGNRQRWESNPVASTDSVFCLGNFHS